MIKLQHIWKEYQSDGNIAFTALKDITFTIKQGEFISIMGPSGSGKSTLMHIIGLLDRPSRGKQYIKKQDVLRLNDNELSKLRNKFVGFVFQQFNLIHKLTVLENIILPTIYARGDLGYNPKEKAFSLIKRFGLEGKEYSYPSKISGGQQQKTALIRALIMNPDLILADEPTGNLDSASGKEILDLLGELNKKEKKTVIVVTHDKYVAKRAKRIVRIRDGILQHTVNI